MYLLRLTKVGKAMRRPEQWRQGLGFGEMRDWCFPLFVDWSIPEK